ncbi:MAG: hypothetical protein HY725_10900 [Candidatus Rokubacteria bacterium]|nr:hypothetical protein [Candidatus Rokubacteria bacterium]
MEWVVGLLIVAALLLAGLGGWRVGRRALQLCPHCGWVVRRVRSGWLRCPRCHRQYGRHAKVRP